MSMQTQCPSCKTVFRLKQNQVSQSGGMARCGVCGHFFNAYKNQDPEVEQHSFTHKDLIVSKSRELAKDALASSLTGSSVNLKPPVPWWSTYLWSILILTVLAALLLQLAWFNREQLVLQPELQPYIERVCERLDCKLKPRVDLENIELLTRDVRSHPTQQQALLITATFINRADFEQPFPDVGVVLSDIEGNIIAQRQFTPDEYLSNHHPGNEMMLKAVPVTMVMEVRDPGSESVSFRFEFL